MRPPCSSVATEDLPHPICCSLQLFQLPSPGPISRLAFQAQAYRASSSAHHSLSSFTHAPPSPRCFLTAHASSLPELHVQNYTQGALATPGLALDGKILDSELLF